MSVGITVIHETFGLGKIIYIFNRDIVSDIVVVEFDSGHKAKFPIDSERLCLAN